ncbi:hypothetical protein QEN19_000420 [Hanseniaspora menglaensis]
MLMSFSATKTFGSDTSLSTLTQNSKFFIQHTSDNNNNNIIPPELSSPDEDFASSFDFVPHDEVTMLRLKNAQSNNYFDNRHYQFNNDLSSNNSSTTELHQTFSTDQFKKIEANLSHDLQTTKIIEKSSGILQSILKKTSSLSLEPRSSNYSDQKSINSSITATSSNSNSSKIVRFASHNNLVRVKTYKSSDTTSCLKKTSSENEANKESKEFIGMNVRYCLRQWYIEEKNKERTERFEQLKKNNTKSGGFLGKENKCSPFKDCTNLQVSKDLNPKKALDFNQDCSCDSGDDESDSDYYCYEDDGLNFKRNSNISKSDNFSGNQDWNKKPNFISNGSSPSVDFKKRNSLTNMASFNYHLRSLEEQKPRASSLDNLPVFGIPSSEGLQLNHSLNIIGSNFNYKKEVICKYPWQYESKTVEMKYVVINNNKNTIAVYISLQNLAFEKDLEVKYSFDSWNNIFFAKGIFSKQINNKFDEFMCIIEIPAEFISSIVNLDFCCVYQVDGLTYYDNNNYNNFKLKIETKNKKDFINKSSETESNSTISNRLKFEQENQIYEKKQDLIAKHYDSKHDQDLINVTHTESATPKRKQMTRKFDSSKEFYNTSPWKNIYRQDSFTNIFCNDKATPNHFTYDDSVDRLVDPIEKLSFDINYVIQNNSETSDSAISSEDDAVKNKMIIEDLAADIKSLAKVRGYSFTPLDSKSGSQFKSPKKISGSIEDQEVFVKNKNIPVYEIKNPLINKFKNDFPKFSNEKVNKKITLYQSSDSEALKNNFNCKQDSKNVVTSVSSIISKFDEEQSKSSNNTIKNFGNKRSENPIDHMLNDTSDYAYQILIPVPYFLTNNIQNCANAHPINEDKESPRIFQDSTNLNINLHLLHNANISSKASKNMYK